MNATIQNPTILRRAAPRLAMLVSLGLVLTVPLAAVSLAFVATLIAALLRSGWWRWWLLIAVLAVVVCMIDVTPFGIGEFRPSQGEPI